MLERFFTSDTHFGHRLMMHQRGFSTVEDMDEALIAAWNAKVPSKAMVYHLGDFAMLPKEKASKLVQRLNGQICLILGNHDYKIPEGLGFSDKLYVYKGDKSKGRPDIVLCHYAMLTWPKKHYGALHLFGHSHGKLLNPTQGSMDVGVDTRADFAPYSEEEILTRLLPSSTL